MVSVNNSLKICHNLIFQRGWNNKCSFHKGKNNIGPVDSNFVAEISVLWWGGQKVEVVSQGGFSVPVPAGRSHIFAICLAQNYWNERPWQVSPPIRMKNLAISTPLCQWPWPSSQTIQGQSLSRSLWTPPSSESFNCDLVPSNQCIQNENRIIFFCISFEGREGVRRIGMAPKGEWSWVDLSCRFWNALFFLLLLSSRLDAGKTTTHLILWASTSLGNFAHWGSGSDASGVVLCNARNTKCCFRKGKMKTHQLWIWKGKGGLF